MTTIGRCESCGRHDVELELNEEFGRWWCKDWANCCLVENISADEPVKVRELEPVLAMEIV